MDIRDFATSRQKEYLTAIDEHGSIRAAGRALDVSESSIRMSIKGLHSRAARNGYSPDHDMTHPVPDGFQVKGVSTLYDADGNAKAQWVKSQADKERQEEMMREAIEALCEDIKPVKPVKAPKDAMSSLMSAYPIGDHHIGMLSWHRETGADYDTPKAEELLIGAMDYLVDAAPKSKVGAVVVLGDFLHYDSFAAVTPQSKNLLDADTRYPKIVRVGMRTVRYAVSKALTKHTEVIVVVSGGNHDPSSMVFLREALSCLYEKEPRVTVDSAPTSFHYLRFGKVLIGIHHGDKVKPEAMPLLMAQDRPVDWGETKHRYCWSGHIHHDKVRDVGGVRVESFRVLPPEDAWAYNAGYRSGRDMKRIDMHAEHGEVARQLVTPEMLT